jgi:hypothetical protein
VCQALCGPHKSWLQVEDQSALAEVPHEHPPALSDPSTNAPLQVWARARAHVPSSCVQSGTKRRLADGREVSAYWRGGRNPDGTPKRPARFVGPVVKRERQRENEARRTAHRADVRKRFTKHRNSREMLGQWKGTRKFEEWLLELAVRVLDHGDEAAVPEVRNTVGCVYN